MVAVYGVMRQLNIKLNENKNNIQFIEKGIKNDKSQINTDSEKHLDVPALTFCELAKSGDIATVVSAKRGLLM